jgi:hypothetical protein
MKTSKRAVILTMVAALVAGSIAGVQWWLGGAEVTMNQPPSSNSASSTAALDGSPAGYRWQVEEHRSWALDLSGTSMTQWAALSGGEEGIQAQVLLRGRLHAQVQAVDPDGSAVIQFWLEDLEQAEFVANVTDEAASAALEAAIDGARLLTHMDRCGSLIGLQQAAESGAGPGVIQAVVQTAWPVVCSDDTTGLVAHRTPHGLALDNIESRTEGAEVVVGLLARSYTELRVVDELPHATRVSVEGQTRLQAGNLVASTLTEILEVGEPSQLLLDAETIISLDGSRVHNERHPSIAAGEWVSPNDTTPSRSMQQQLLQRRAGELSAEELRATLENWGASGTVPNHNDFLWRAPARIALNPELAGEIADMVVAENATSAGRGLMLDLLSQTSHPAATAGLLRSLRHATVQADRMYPILLQRVSFVQEPSEELVMWVAEQSEGAVRSNDRVAAQYALGSLVAAMDSSAVGSVADAAHAVLLRNVSSALSEEVQVHALRALANARRPSDQVVFTSAASSVAPSVRRAAAESLAGMRNAAAMQTLLVLVVDVDEDVQRTAIASLREQAIQPETLTLLSSAARGGEVHADNALHLLDLAKYYVDSSPAQVLSLAESVEAMAVDAQTIAASRELARRAQDTGRTL